MSSTVTAYSWRAAKRTMASVSPAVSATSAATAFEAMRGHPTANAALLELRAAVGANVPERLGRRITRFRGQLDEQATMVKAAAGERA